MSEARDITPVPRVARRAVVATMIATTAAVAALATTLVAAADDARAHGGSGKDYRSTITGIEPADLPIEAQIKGGDDEIRIENVGNEELIVYGYEHEPDEQVEDRYVRIGPDGVLVNRNSTAYYLNQDRYGTTVPDGVGEGADDFELVREAPLFYSFHDHRIHWMSKRPPPQIDADSPKEQKVYDWEVPVRYGDTEGSIRGTLTYIGGKKEPIATLETWLVGGAVTAMLVVFGLDWWRRRRRKRGGAASEGGA